MAACQCVGDLQNAIGRTIEDDHFSACRQCSLDRLRQADLAVDEHDGCTGLLGCCRRRRQSLKYVGELR